MSITRAQPPPFAPRVDARERTVGVRLRSLALAGRNALARVVDQAGTVNVGLGPFNLTLWSPQTPHQRPAETPAPSRHQPAVRCPCLACRAGRDPR